MTRVLDVQLIFETDPTLSGKKYWDISITNPNVHREEFENIIIDKYIDFYGQEAGLDLWDSYHDSDLYQYTLLLFPVSLNGGQDGGQSFGSSVYAYYRTNSLNITTHSIAHELGHSILDLADKGHDKNRFTDDIDGVSMGMTFSTTGTYDLMYHSDCFPSPYSLYGLIPMHTQDLINIPWNILDNITTINENEICNKSEVRLKTVRKELTDEEVANGISDAVILPIKDTDHSDDYLNNLKLEDQHFLIEYKNGEGFDNYSSLDHENECKGILISHVINGSELNSVIDIECAVPFPEGDRVGLSSDLFFCGKPVNDWMDDLLPNDVYDECLGGLGAWYQAPTAINMFSLPTDFFNDSDRNKFTPFTRPNTNSWKGKETNIGIYIDNIDGDFAEVTVYRNYHSVPLTKESAKQIIEGHEALAIEGDGYIGENFSVGDDTFLYLGGGSDTPKTTLVPNTNMHVMNNGRLSVLPNSSLRLEESTLTFDEGAKYRPDFEAVIELSSSNLIFDDGALIDFGDFNNYNILIEGESSFYHSDFELIEGSLLTMGLRSTLNLISGTTLTVANDSKLMFKYGSDLVIKDGSTLVLEEGADIEFVYGSKIIVKNGGSLKLLERSELVITDGIDLIIEPDAIVEAETGAKITVKDGAVLDLTDVTITGNTTWQGIVAEVGNSVTLSNSNISNA
ncbi:MAG: hypothetical protein JXR48_00005, partial [Candidatus Delongbacteria bacterium]|nr:hypothetical protein [Candidatus Delongbacteria bacterium]